jgi:hypothetical protein
VSDKVPGETAALSGGDGSLAVTFLLEGGAGASGSRSIAGPSYNGPGTFNYAQVIVLDADKKLANWAAVRVGGTETGSTIRIKGVNHTDKYTFLALTGHWQRDYTESYKYVEDASPTLLGVGYLKDTAATNGTVSIPVYILKVDTVFEANGDTVEPVISEAGKPAAVSLNSAKTWTVKWSIEGSGFENLFKAAEKDAGSLQNGDFGAVFPADKNKGILRIGGSSNNPETKAVTITQAGEITLDIGTVTTGGSVTFNLEYTAFNGLADIGWDEREKPKGWIIRNGVNDKEQNAGTVFDKTTAWTGTDADKPNGNGAVLFTVAGPP